MPSLVVRTRSSEHTLRGGTIYRIGRDPKADIVVEDSRVSWQHGVLRLDGNTWVLEDVGSTNGTFVGLQRIDRFAVVVDCVVHLGNPDDGPVLRCMPEATAAARPAQVPAGPARPLPPGPSSPRPRPPSSRPASPSRPAAPGPAPRPRHRRPRRARLPRHRLPAARRPPAPSPPICCPASTSVRPPACRCRPRPPCASAASPTTTWSSPTWTCRATTPNCASPPPATYEIVDLGSHNGTFVNGRRVSSAVIGEDDIVSIGRSTFRLAGGELRQFVDDGEVTFSAQDLVVKVGGGKVLLNRVTFPIPEKSLVGVIGPSGAGKSTLLGALTGMRPADTGTVLYDNRDLYRNYAELRHRIGLVPQESVLHTQLTARRALQYSAELRFPADTGAHERDARVDEVMSELGLTKHANTRADRLSGGQLKRVNVAQELLTKPSLLFLDEPTSGLDPGLDKSVMEQMRDLAHDGRTVIVVTHSVANLDTCDRLLVLVPGGKVAYYGPPDEGLEYFGLAGWAEVFQAFERYPDRDWAAEYTASRPTPSTSWASAPSRPPRPQGQATCPTRCRSRAARSGRWAR